MADELTAAMVAPLEGPVPLDRGGWRDARGAAESTLAGLAVRRAGAGPFRVTDHDVRVAVAGAGAGSDNDDGPFAWSAWTARRTIGLAAVRSLLGGEARTPHDAVRARLAYSDRGIPGRQQDGLPARPLGGIPVRRRSQRRGGRSGHVGHPAVVRAGLARPGRAVGSGTRPMVGQPALCALGATRPGRRAHPGGAPGGAVGTAGVHRCAPSWPWLRWWRRCGRARTRRRRRHGWWAGGPTPATSCAWSPTPACWHWRRTQWRPCWPAALHSASPRPEPSGIPGRARRW